MNKQETKFENYGVEPQVTFYYEIQKEAQELGLNDLQVGMGAIRKAKCWEIVIDYCKRIDFTDLVNLIKCNKDTIKFYDKDFNERFIYEKLNSENSAVFNLYTVEAVKTLLNFLKHFNVSIKTYTRGFQLENTFNCRVKSNVKSAVLLEEPCYITNENNMLVLCNKNTYIVVDNDDKLSNVNKETFDNLYEKY